MNRDKSTKGEFYCVSNGVFAGNGSTSTPVCICEYTQIAGEAKANAEKIVKAVNSHDKLLEALKNMVETYEHSRGLLHMEELHPVYHSAKKVLNELEK